MKPHASLFAVVIATAFASCPVHAATHIAPIFSDHAVVQAGKPIPVWGTDSAGQSVNVTLGDQSKIAQTGADGKWSVTFDPMQSGSPLVLKAEGSSTFSVNDVLVGEVWICAGQSNMALPVSKAMNFDAERTAANFPDIRMLVNNHWIQCSPETVGNFSAAAYFFGREIEQKQKTPVGLINCSSGGTPIELWTSTEAQQAVPEISAVLNAPPAAQFSSQADAAQAQSDQNQAKEVEGKKAIDVAKTGPGYLFNSRIMPLVPYAIRGVIWYQGEANSYTTHANIYGLQIATMIKDWRNRWGYDFSFISVQLPEIGKPQADPVETCGRVLVREGELQSLSLPNTGLAVLLGTGEIKSNHPVNKQEAGKRLADWALATVYQQKDVVASGPLPESNKVDGDKITITFSHADGLTAQGGGDLKGFAIAGSDMKFVWGTATISGNTVSVSSPDVSRPVAVRYAWASNPAEANLYNGAGLPATPFRTDTQSLTNTFMH